LRVAMKTIRVVADAVETTLTNPKINIAVAA
jgi:hypothetical protein